jgi:hypothetical protein
MSRATPLRLLHVFTARTGVVLPLPLPFICIDVQIYYRYYIYIYIYIYICIDILPFICIYDISSLNVNDLTLILLTWRKW